MSHQEVKFLSVSYVNVATQEMLLSSGWIDSFMSACVSVIMSKMSIQRLQLQLDKIVLKLNSFIVPLLIRGALCASLCDVEHH